MFKGINKGLKDFTPIFQGLIAFAALIGLFSFAMDLVIKPIKKDVSSLEEGQTKLETGQTKLEEGQTRIKEELKKDISKLAKKIDEALNQTPKRTVQGKQASMRQTASANN